MRLTFVGKDPDSNPTGSPTVYRTEAGEDIRWVPRSRVSSVAVPGNDFYLFDDRLAVFLLYAGDGLAAGRLGSADPADIRLCRSAFEAVWKLSIPHREYAPV